MKLVGSSWGANVVLAKDQQQLNPTRLGT